MNPNLKPSGARPNRLRTKIVAATTGVVERNKHGNAAIHPLAILTTHSAELLDAFSEFAPTVTVAKWQDGQTSLTVVSPEQLQYWLEDYTLGKIFRMGRLEDVG